ncbi:hypothetical protein GQ53DRAFT_265280 [Thozetella sp. PMI_491]|nr:hypothetical protein GQ53DRAFT_265280 [Thozetella sp. PMI_491]
MSFTHSLPLCVGLQIYSSFVLTGRLPTGCYPTPAPTIRLFRVILSNQVTSSTCAARSQKILGDFSFRYETPAKIP